MWHHVWSQGGQLLLLLLLLLLCWHLRRLRQRRPLRLRKEQPRRQRRHGLPKQLQRVDRHHCGLLLRLQRGAREQQLQRGVRLLARCPDLPALQLRCLCCAAGRRQICRQVGHLQEGEGGSRMPAVGLQA